MRKAVFLTSLFFAALVQGAIPASDCDFSQGPCTSQGASLVLAPKPLASQSPITVTLTLPQAGPEQLLALVEGVDMYMGQVPVPLKKNERGAYVGQFQVAACLHGAMTWQLQVKGSASQYRFNFVVDGQ